MAAPSSRIDVGVIIALVWLMVAVAMTVLYGPELGLRGWLWLGFHHVLCVLGASHELWRVWRTRRVAD